MGSHAAINILQPLPPYVPQRCLDALCYSVDHSLTVCFIPPPRPTCFVQQFVSTWTPPEAKTHNHWVCTIRNIAAISSARATSHVFVHVWHRWIYTWSPCLLLCFPPLTNSFRVTGAPYCIATVWGGARHHFVDTFCRDQCRELCMHMSVCDSKQYVACHLIDRPVQWHTQSQPSPHTYFC